MKKWNVMVLLAALLVGGIGCQDNGETVKTNDGKELQGPAEYNDYLVGRQNEVIAKFKALNQAYDSFDSTAIEKAYADLQRKIDKTIADVEKLPGYGQDTTLRNAALEMFRYYQKITDEELQRIGEIVSQGKNNIPEEEVDEVDSLYNNFRKEIKTYEITFADAQKDFAKEHGMKIKGKGEKEKAEE